MLLCCGEALIDMIPLTGSEGESGFRPLAGGAIFNTAIGLGRLGVPVGMVSGISTDLFGRRLVASLHASHVDTHYLIRSALPTTLAFVTLNEGHASYTFYDENSAGQSVRFEQVPALPEKVTGLYFGGISLIAEPAGEAYCQLAERNANHKIIMLDPNIRASFINDEIAYRDRLKRMIAVADIVKVSDEDLDWLVPDDVSIEQKIIELRQRANQWILVTKGSRGSVAFGPNNEIIEQAGRPTQVVDTIGAGDTFNSGFLASLFNQRIHSKASVSAMTTEQMKAALAMASQVAAITVSRAGANPPWKQDL